MGKWHIGILSSPQLAHCCCTYSTVPYSYPTSFFYVNIVEQLPHNSSTQVSSFSTVLTPVSAIHKTTTHICAVSQKASNRQLVMFKSPEPSDMLQHQLDVYQQVPEPLRAPGSLSHVPHTLIAFSEFQPAFPALSCVPVTASPPGHLKCFKPLSSLTTVPGTVRLSR